MELYIPHASCILCPDKDMGCQHYKTRPPKFTLLDYNKVTVAQGKLLLKNIKNTLYR
jgi:hypothetical protein